MKARSATLVAALITLFSVGAAADYRIDRGAIRDWRPQDVVITFSKDLEEITGDTMDVNEASLEQACLALTLAQFLRTPELNGGNRFVNVTLFVRNDGVKLADPALVEEISDWQRIDLSERGCKIPNPDPGGLPIDRALDEHLDSFLMHEPEGNPDFVNCPICWCTYRPESCQQDFPYGNFYPGIIDSMAIPPLLLGADKVIDF